MLIRREGEINRKGLKGAIPVPRLYYVCSGVERGPEQKLVRRLRKERKRREK